MISRCQDLELGKEYLVSMLPKACFVGKPFAVILSNPSPGDILLERFAAREKGIDPLFIAVVEPFRRSLLEAAFPDTVVVDDKSGIKNALSTFKRRGEEKFTAMEKRVLSEMPYGLTAKELSLRLGVSERSARRTKESLMRKTGLLSSEHLALYALLRSVNISIRSS